MSDSGTGDLALSILRPRGVRPSSPYRVIATAGAGSGLIDVQWQHRQPVGLTSYILTPSAGAAVTVAANGRGAQSAQLTGLTNGAALSVRVQAVNPSGTSAVSDASNSVTPTALPATTLGFSPRLLEYWWSARRAAAIADAADITAAQVLDLSGNGYNGNPRTGNVDGTNRFSKWKANWSNGKPAIRFLGNGDRIDIAPGLVPGMRGSRATIALVFAAEANPSVPANRLSGRVLSTEISTATAIAIPNYGIDTSTGYQKGTNRLGISVGSTAGQVNPTIVSDSAGQGDGTPDRTSIAGPAVALGAPVVLVATTLGALRINGAAVSSALPINPIVFDPMLAQQASWEIGAEYNANGNYNFQGYLAEVMIFADVLTAPEIAALETYLAGAY